MKQILAWSGSVLALASVFSTAAQAVGGSVGVNQGKKMTSTAGERRASEPPSYAVPPVAKKILSEEEKLKILHQDSMAYVSTQGGKRFKEADWVSWFMTRYGKDEAFAKTWLAKLKVYDAKLKAVGQVTPPKTPAAIGTPPPTVAPPPPLPPRTSPLPPPLTNVPPLSSFPKPPGNAAPSPLGNVPPPPPLPTVAPPPSPPRKAPPLPTGKLKPAAERELAPPKSEEKTLQEILSEQMEARREAIEPKDQDAGNSENSEEW